MDEQYLKTKKSTWGSWWKKRTRIEKWLFLLTAILFILLVIILLIKLMPSSSGKASQDICLSPDCVKAASQVLERVDLSADPCDDFYKFTCGSFVKNTILPTYKRQLKSFDIVGDTVNEQMRTLLEKPINETDDKSSVLVKSIYQACMNTTAINARSRGNLQRIIKNLGGWPVIEGLRWNDRNFNWKNLIYEFTKLGVNTNSMLFYLTVDSDPSNSSRRILILQEPLIALSFKQGINDPQIRTYYEYIVKVLTNLGAEQHRAEREGSEIVHLYRSLAKILMPLEEKRNFTLLQNRRTIKELEQEFPYLNWLQYFNMILKPVKRMNYEDTVIVMELKFFQKLGNILKTASKRALANYLFWHMYTELLPYLSEDLVNIKAEFSRKTYGKTDPQPRWRACVDNTILGLQAAAGSLYVKHFFNKESKQSSMEIVNNILSIFFKELEHISWMDKLTREKAIAKAKTIRAFIAYPDELLDNDRINEYYKNLTVNASEYMESMHNLSLFAELRAFSQLDEPIDKEDWRTHIGVPYVNAFYNTNDNSISFPASILQNIFFSNERPKYMNYGAIGYVIGHEIIHGFDDEGSQYDKDGNLANWWQPQTAEAFKEKAQCIIDQYGNITVPEIGINLNGIITQGENIADNGGTKYAYLAYKKWIEEHNPELLLPGLPYTPEQMFWISVGTTWCEITNPKALKDGVLYEAHSPHRYRVNVPLMNSEYFAKDFNCPLGSKMNPKHKCTVW